MDHRIGIIGGGQLGYFLCRAARDLGIHTTILTDSLSDPACAAADQVLAASSEHPKILEQLISEVDTVTFEKEAISPKWLKFLACAEHFGKIRVFPHPKTMLLLQNKGLQKEWLTRQGFPTAPFETLDEPSSDFGILVEKLGLPLVQKTLRGGYDGFGVQILRDESYCEHLWPVPSLVEAYVERQLELSVLVARTDNGALMSYTPIGLKFDDAAERDAGGRVPGQDRRGNPSRSGRSRRTHRRTSGRRGRVCHRTVSHPDGRLLVNEISPRVHNSGHHTLESCGTSQFEQHLRAICGLTLGAADQQQAAATRNLLCTPEIEVLCRTGVSAYKISFPETHLHWYGKSEARPGRKLGHVTALGPDTETAAERSRLEFEHLVRYAGELPAMTIRVGIVMGSDSDLPVMQKAAEQLEALAVTYELNIVSAHRTPDRLLNTRKTPKPAGSR